MRKLCGVAATVATSVLFSAAQGQVRFSGRVWTSRIAGEGRPLLPADGIIEDYFAPGRPPDNPDAVMLANIRCFATRRGPDNETLQARTWEMAPTGWYTMGGGAGDYTMIFTGSAVCFRPVVVTNVFTQPGDGVDRKVAPRYDYGVFTEKEWDDHPATDYYQTFVAKGSAVTQVGFRLVHDGVDGIGPGSRTILVSIHRKADGTPDRWPQVGPSIPVFGVDAGGPKLYDWAAAWNSGEVPLVRGETYAVHLRAEEPGGTFQAFWRTSDRRDADCYRLGPKGPTGFRGRNLRMAVGTDGDGLLIPYNKRIQKEYVEFAGFASKWSQTYVAQGRSLAFAGMYAAVGTSQPALSRQRAIVRVREGGAAGPVVGVEKIAIGNGIYTGDASWGMFGVVYAPGEVPLEPGRTYAIEFESIENYESMHGYVNIKGVVCDEKAGFNPYRKTAPETYADGTAYKGGREDAGFDLDMQIVEYEHAARDWGGAVDATNLLENGDMEAGTFVAEAPEKGTLDRWRTFAVDPGTTHVYWADGPERNNRIARVLGGGPQGRGVDGGYVQRVEGLSHLDTYRLTGLVRSSYPVTPDNAACVGLDATGQTDDPGAATIVWTAMPDVHSVWMPYAGGPVRPKKDAVSVWLRGRLKGSTSMPFRADFDGFALRRVCTGVPSRSAATSARSGATTVETRGSEH